MIFKIEGSEFTIEELLHHISKGRSEHFKQPIIDALIAAERERAEYKAMVSYQGECIINAESAMRDAERERDEAIMTRLEVSEGLSIATRRYELAEAELARRDAAAGEPDGYIFCHPSGKNFWSVSHPDTAGHNGVKPFYFGAQPAVLPALKVGLQRADRPFESGKIAGWNECVIELKAIGAQPQKPVVLPALFNLKMARDVKTKQYFKGSNDTIKQIAGLLDAANVPYEVKK